MVRRLNPSTDPRLAEVWDEHASTTCERIACTQAAAIAVQAGSADPGLLEEAAVAVHNLAGFVGMFGFNTATDSCRELEALLRSDDDPDQTRIADLAAEIADELLEADDSAPAPAPAPVSALPLVLLATADPLMRTALAGECSARGLRTVLARKATDVAVQIARERPVVAIADLQSVPDTDGGIALMAALAEGPRPIPVLALETDDGLERRVAVTQAGAHAFLDRSLAPAEIIDQTALLVERHAIPGARVLVVDTDDQALAATQELFTRAGLVVEILSSPDELWEALPRVDPDLVVLALEAAGGAGLELCRVMRADARWSVVPIVVSATEAAPEQVRQCFAAGASDFVAKPIGEELLVRVRSQLERYRLHQALAETDPLTGLANRRTSTTRLLQMLRLARRMDKPVSLAQIDVDRFKQVNDRYGHLAGDIALRRLAEVLRRSFRGEDVIARWGGEEFVVGMFDTPRDAGVDRLTDVLAKFRKETIQHADDTFSLTFSAGVAEYPTDGESLEALYEVADGALYAAKRGGRDRIVGARPAGTGAQEVVDVAVIEDDDATAGLITDALEDAGYRWWRFSSGVSAGAALAGATPRLRARVVVLDIGLPALDGFEVLDLLARDHVTSATKVIMLTARTDPAASRKARGLGAIGYITKPFQIAEVIAEVRLALGR